MGQPSSSWTQGRVEAPTPLMTPPTASVTAVARAKIAKHWLAAVKQRVAARATHDPRRAAGASSSVPSALGTNDARKSAHTSPVSASGIDATLQGVDSVGNETEGDGGGGSGDNTEVGGASRGGHGEDAAAGGAESVGASLSEVSSHVQEVASSSPLPTGLFVLPASSSSSANSGDGPGEPRVDDAVGAIDGQARSSSNDDGYVDVPFPDDSHTVEGQRWSSALSALEQLAACDPEPVAGSDDPQRRHSAGGSQPAAADLVVTDAEPFQLMILEDDAPSASPEHDTPRQQSSDLHTSESPAPPLSEVAGHQLVASPSPTSRGPASPSSFAPVVTVGSVPATNSAPSPSADAMVNRNVPAVRDAPSPGVPLGDAPPTTVVHAPRFAMTSSSVPPPEPHSHVTSSSSQPPSSQGQVPPAEHLSPAGHVSTRVVAVPPPSHSASPSVGGTMSSGAPKTAPLTKPAPRTKRPRRRRRRTKAFAGFANATAAPHTQGAPCIVPRPHALPSAQFAADEGDGSPPIEPPEVQTHPATTLSGLVPPLTDSTPNGFASLPAPPPQAHPDTRVAPQQRSARGGGGAGSSVADMPTAPVSSRVNDDSIAQPPAPEPVTRPGPIPRSTEPASVPHAKKRTRGRWHVRKWSGAPAFFVSGSGSIVSGPASVVSGTGSSVVPPHNVSPAAPVQPTQLAPSPRGSVVSTVSRPHRVNTAPHHRPPPHAPATPPAIPLPVPPPIAMGLAPDPAELVSWAQAPPQGSGHTLASRSPRTMGARSSLLGRHSPRSLLSTAGSMPVHVGVTPQVARLARDVVKEDERSTIAVLQSTGIDGHRQAITAGVHAAPRLSSNASQARASAAARNDAAIQRLATVLDPERSAAVPTSQSALRTGAHRYAVNADPRRRYLRSKRAQLRLMQLV